MLIRGEAKFVRHVLSAPVSHFVASIWYGENQPAHEFERFLPTGEIDLVVNVRDAELRRYEVDVLDSPRRYVGPVVSGAHSQPYVIHTAQQASLLGVRFKRGRARDAIGLPLDVLGNEHVALSDIWGSAAFALQDSAMSAKTPEDLFVRVEGFLGERLRSARGPHPAIAEAVRALAGAQEPSPVSAVAAASGLSARRFIEVFCRDVGLRPKQFSRVMRFRRALSLLRRRPDESLSALAVEAGYYDQAHFTREFKQLSGLSPTAYRSASGAYDNQVPILGVKSMQDRTPSRR